MTTENTNQETATMHTETTNRFVVDNDHPAGLWRVVDSLFEGPGSVFSAPVVRVVTTAQAADEVARELNAELDHGNLDEFPECPACGEPIDYCLGHGSIA